MVSAKKTKTDVKKNKADAKTMMVRFVCIALVVMMVLSVAITAIWWN